MTNKYVALEGGLDLVTPALEAKGGKCVTALNVYESVRGGYKAMQGYEVFDGQPAPSDVNRFSQPNGDAWASDAAWQEEMQDRREAIGQPPGDGPIRGVAQILGVVLAWRNDGSKLKVYRATATGWKLVPYRSGGSERYASGRYQNILRQPQLLRWQRHVQNVLQRRN